MENAAELTPDDAPPLDLSLPSRPNDNDSINEIEASIEPLENVQIKSMQYNEFSRRYEIVQYKAVELHVTPPVTSVTSDDEEFLVRIWIRHADPVYQDRVIEGPDGPPFVISSDKNPDKTRIMKKSYAWVIETVLSTAQPSLYLSFEVLSSSERNRGDRHSARMWTLTVTTDEGAARIPLQVVRAIRDPQRLRKRNVTKGVRRRRCKGCRKISSVLMDDLKKMHGVLSCMHRHMLEVKGVVSEIQGVLPLPPT